MVHPLRAGEFGLSRTMHLHYNNIKKKCQNRTVLLWTMTYSDYPVDPKIRGENVWFWKSVVYIFILIYSLYKLGIFISRAQKRIHRTKIIFGKIFCSVWSSSRVLLLLLRRRPAKRKPTLCVYALLSSHLDWTNLLGLLVHYGLGFSFGKGETS